MRKGLRFATVILSILIACALFTACDGTKKHKVVFDFDVENIKNVTVSVKDGDTVNAPDKSRDGYILDFWTLDGSKYDFTKAVDNDMTLKAVWVRAYKVEFDLGYSGATTINSQVVREGGKITMSDPVREGFTFAGWYNGENKFDLASSVNSDMKLVARWSQGVEVTFDSNYEGSVNEPSQKVESGSSIKWVIPTREGYEFDGWYKDAALTQAFGKDEKVTADITLYAAWVKTWKVTFLSEGVEIDTVEVRDGGSCDLVGAPEYIGDTNFPYLTLFFVFEEWDADLDNVTSDMQVNAIFKYVPTSNDKDYFIFELNEDGKGYTVTVDWYTARECDYMGLPDTYNGLPVTDIGGEQGMTLGGGTFLYVPGSYKKITYNTFNGYHKSIYFAEGVEKILAGAFNREQMLETVHIPKSMVDIEPYALNWTHSITNFVIEEGSCFKFDKKSLTLYTDYGKELVWVNRSVTELLIPAEVKYVRPNACDWNTKLKKLTIAAKGVVLGDCSFSYCSSLVSIDFEDGGYIEKIYGIDDVYENYEVPTSNTRTGAFYNCKGLTSIDLPYGLKYVGKSAFGYCSDIASVTVPETLEYWGETAIMNGPKGVLDSIKMVDQAGKVVTVSKNGKYVIDGNSIIEKGTGELYNGKAGDTFVILAQGHKTADGTYTVPQGVTSFHQKAMCGLMNIRHVIIPEGPETLSTYMFGGCVEIIDTDGMYFATSLEEVTLPSTIRCFASHTVGVLWSGYESTGDGVFRWAKRFNKMNWPNGCYLERIESSVFLNTAYVEFEIPASVIDVDNGFMGMSRLERFTVQEGNPIFGAYDGVLYDKALETIIMYPSAKKDTIFVGPDSLKEIGVSVFSGNSYIEEVRPNSLETLGRSAMGNMPNLTTVVLPENFKTMQGGCVANSLALESVTFKGKVPTFVTGESGFFDHSYKVGVGDPIVEIIPGLKLYVPDEYFGEYYAALYRFNCGSYSMDYSKIIVEPAGRSHEYNFYSEGELLSQAFTSAVDEIVIPTYKGAGKKYFQGWYTQSDPNVQPAGTHVNFPYYAIGDSKLYARWEDSRIYQDGLSIVFGYELSSTPREIKIPQSTVYFLYDCTSSGTYTLKYTQFTYVFAYAGLTNMGPIVNEYDTTIDTDGNRCRKLHLQAGQTYSIVLLLSTDGDAEVGDTAKISVVKD